MFGFLFAGRKKAPTAAAAQPAVVGDGAASDTSSSSSIESPTYDWDQMTRVSLVPCR
jgi:hypothetical protein